MDEPLERDDARAAPAARTAAWSLLAAAAVYAVAALAVFPKWTVDDAYITYRYAENLALHGELTWNAGLDPVEGYTGVLLPVILAGAIRSGIDPDLASKTLGVVATVASAVLLWLALRRLATPRTVAAAATFCYATIPVLYAHAWSGLETMVFAALAMASIYALVACVDRSHPRPRAEIAFFALLLVSALARPEGAVLAGVGTMALLAERAVSRRPVVPTLVRGLLVLALPGALYFAWRVGYYGQWLPNTYYAKARRDFQPKSLTNMGVFARIYLLVPFAAALGALLLRLRRRGGSGPEAAEREELRRARLLAAGAVVVFVGACAVQYCYSALRMNFAHRFFVPFLPLLLFLAALGVAAGIRGAWSRLPRAVSAVLIVVLVVAGLSQVRANVHRLAGEVHQAAAYEQLLELVHIPAGKFIRDRVPPDEWMVVVLDAGAMPYFSKLKTIDFGGLGDEFLSKRRTTKIPKAKQADYFFSVNPGVVVFTTKRPDRVDPNRARRFANVLEDPRFEQYEHVATFSPTSHRYYELVFFRRDLAPLARNR